MLPTEREVMAYDLRRDAEYARRRLAEHDYDSDSPTLPAVLAAAHRFSLWCDAASDELVTNPDTNVDAVRETWRHEAVASDIRFIPHGDFAALVGLGCGAMAAMFAVIGLMSGSTVVWIYAAALGVVAVATFGYRRWTPSRLAVGPDARHSTLAAASARDLLNPGAKTRTRRYQSKPGTSKPVR